MANSSSKNENLLLRHITNKRLLLSIIVLIALAVRIYGLNFPLYHWDEKGDIDNMLYASHNQLSLMLYAHGSFLHYIILTIWSVYLLFQGILPSSQNIISAFVKDPERLVLLARSFLVFVSTATIVLTYYLGKYFDRSKTGLLAAFFLALNFLHASQSHYTRGHILATFFVSLTAYFCIKIHDGAKMRDYVLAGMSVGLATAAHIPLVINVLPLVITHFLSKSAHQQDSKWVEWILNRSFLLGLITIAVSFLIVTPYALLDFWRVAAQLKFFFLQAAGQVWVSSEGQPILVFYLREHLRHGMGLLLEILAFIGIVYALFKRNKTDWILLTFFASLLIVVVGKANFARYALPLLPFLMVFAARLLVKITDRLPAKWHTPVLVTLSLILVFPSTQKIIRFDYWLTQPDTRELAVSWFIENVPAGATVITEGADVLSPNLPLNTHLLDEQIANNETGSFWQVYFQALRDNASENTGYNLKRVSRLNKIYDGEIQVVENAVYYQEKGIKYLISVDWIRRDPDEVYLPEFQASLDKLYRKVAVFEPTIVFRWDPYCWRMDYEALSEIQLGKTGVAGPRITIYQLR